MGMGSQSLTAQLQALHSGMKRRLPAADLDALRQADMQLGHQSTGRDILPVGASGPDFTLQDQCGAQVRLSDRLAQGPMVLLFNRGGWCPFCTLQMRAWQSALEELHDAGGDLLAILPQHNALCCTTAERDLLAYSVLSDIGSRVAAEYGVLTEVPKVVRPLYVRLGHELPRINGTDDWRIPLASTFVLDRDGRITLAHADVAAPYRLEPARALAAVRALTGAAASEEGGEQPVLRIS